MAPTYTCWNPNVKRALTLSSNKYVEWALHLLSSLKHSSNENEPLDLIGWHPRIYIGTQGGKCLSFHVFHIAMHYTLHYSSWSRLFFCPSSHANKGQVAMPCMSYIIWNVAMCKTPTCCLSYLVTNGGKELFCWGFLISSYTSILHLFKKVKTPPCATYIMYIGSSIHIQLVALVQHPSNNINSILNLFKNVGLLWA
jgi:hypothetical protein